MLCIVSPGFHIHSVQLGSTEREKTYQRVFATRGVANKFRSAATDSPCAATVLAHPDSLTPQRFLCARNPLRRNGSSPTRSDRMGPMGPAPERGALGYVSTAPGCTRCAVARRIYVGLFRRGLDPTRPHGLYVVSPHRAPRCITTLSSPPGPLLRTVPTVRAARGAACRSHAARAWLGRVDAYPSLSNQGGRVRVVPVGQSSSGLGVGGGDARERRW